MRAQVRSRARNALGWSAEWSDWSSEPASGCATQPVPIDTTARLYMLIGVLGGSLICLLATALLCWKYNLPKVFAPKLRRKVEEEVKVEDFMSSDFMPMEDEDPELFVNPVMAAKVQMRKDREARAKKARGGMCARSGGLKRLNLSVASDEGGKKGPVGPAAQRRQIEGFFGVEEAPKKTVRELALEKGVSDKRMNRRLKEVTTHSKCSSQGIALSAVGGGEASSGARKPIGMSENL